MEATWIITTVILITTAGGRRLALERRGAKGASPPDRKELIEALRTKFTLKCQPDFNLSQVRVKLVVAVPVGSLVIFLSFSPSLLDVLTQQTAALQPT